MLVHMTFEDQTVRWAWVEQRNGPRRRRALASYGRRCQIRPHRGLVKAVHAVVADRRCRWSRLRSDRRR